MIQKNYLINKSNEFIFLKYDLSLQEQRIILLLCSIVQPTDEDFKEYIFNVKEFMDLLGMKGQSAYTDLPKITKKLMEKVWEYTDDNGVLKQRHWVESADHLKREGKIILKLSGDLKPFLLQLKKYTSYKLQNVLNIKSKYSLRIYEILKSEEFKKKNFTISLDELKCILLLENIPSYNTYNNFKRKIILKAQEELELYTDIKFEFEEIKKGRKVESIKFIILKNKNTSLDEISVKPIEFTVDKEDKINIISSLSNNKFTENELKDIIKASDNIETIKKAIEYTNNKKYENIVGAIISICKKIDKGTFNEVKTNQNAKQLSFNNFEPRQHSERYLKLQELILIGQASPEEIEEFEELRIS